MRLTTLPDDIICLILDWLYDVVWPVHATHFSMTCKRIHSLFDLANVRFLSAHEVDWVRLCGWPANTPFHRCVKARPQCLANVFAFEGRGEILHMDTLRLSILPIFLDGPCRDDLYNLLENYTKLCTLRKDAFMSIIERVKLWPSEQIRALLSAPHLFSLTLQFCHFPLSFIKNMSLCNRLRQLKIRSAQLSDSYMVFLSKNLPPLLSYLSVANNTIGDKAASELSCVCATNNIIMLDVSFNWITDIGGTALSHLNRNKWILISAQGNMMSSSVLGSIIR